MKNITVSISWTNPYTDVEYDVEATVSPATRGTREPFSRFQEPDDPAEIEFSKIEGWNDILKSRIDYRISEFSKKERIALEEAVLEYAAETACESYTEY